MRVRVITDRYVASHARQPRGTGRWAFRIGTEVVAFHGSYTLAKGRAMDQALQQHALSGAPWTAVLYVEVLP